MIQVLVYLSASVAFAQTPPAPTGLTVRAATSRRVDLTWTAPAGSFLLERRVLNGTYAPIGTLTATSATDDRIDPMETYQYRVRATLPTGNSDPSNEVTAGPPPVGLAPVLPFTDRLAEGGADSAGYGASAQMILDTNGDPAFIYLFRDPNLLGHPEDTEVWFKSWNRVRYRWNDEVKIAQCGDIGGYTTPMSLAQDPSNGMWAVAFEDENLQTMPIYTSTDGVEWQRIHTIPMGETSATLSPSLAVNNGVLHLSYLRYYEGLHYVTGRYADNPSTWQDRVVPAPGGTETPAGVSTSMALDSKGVPAIAYWSNEGDYNRVLAFWRPGMDAPVRVTDTQGTQSDFLDVRMIFQGDNPRILLFANRDSSLYYEKDWVVRSENGGGTWTTPVYIPRDGGDHSVDTPFDLSIDRAGRGAVAFASTGGQGNDVCPGIKLSRSDDLSNWKTCSFLGSTSTEFSEGTTSIQLRFAANDRLYLLFQQIYPSSIGRGLMLWREQ